MSVEVGDRAPDFALRDQHGATVELASLRGDRLAVVMFYPYAFSRVCSSELAGVRDVLPSLDPERVQVLALSCDPMFALRAFADADGLTFPLLSDFWPHGAVASSYGVLDAERGCARRSTFVLDLDGVVRWSVHAAMAESRDPDQLVAAVAALLDKPGS